MNTLMCLNRKDPGGWRDNSKHPEWQEPNEDQPINDKLDWFGKKIQKCLHNNCSECHGSGRRKDGTPHIHMISCPCTRCKPYSL